MFYIGTKIVVIGSNIKRKAGPRIGSTGFIIGIAPSKGVIDTINNNKIEFNVCGATILFTKYGFQKCNRLEIKKVYLIVPNIVKMGIDVQNSIQTIKKTLKFNNNTDINNHTLLLVGPANNFNDLDIVNKIICYLWNATIRQKIYSVINLPSSKDLPNKEKLLSTFSIQTREFLIQLLEIHNTNIAYNLLLSTKDFILKDILNLIIKLNSLSIIVNKASKKINNISTEAQLFNSLFKPFELNAIWEKPVSLTIKRQCMALCDYLSKESEKILI